jgi:RNA polymerase sigma-70 factor (ECF subfamily)
MLFKRGRSAREQFERQTEAIFPALMGVALRLTRNQEEAEDLTQEAIVRGFDAFDRFDGQNFKAWMLRILTNLYINRYRRLKRTGTNVSLDEEKMQEPAAPEGELPDRAILDSMLSADVEAALERVPESFRLAVILSDLEGLSYEEVAQALEVPIGTVRSRIARGRAHLRAELESFAVEMGYIKRSAGE